MLFQELSIPNQYLCINRIVNTTCCAGFDAWDAHAGRINSIGFTWMHDETTADVAAIIANPAFGGMTNPPPDMVEFLRTLGLRTEDAEDKAGWVRLTDAAKARGWSDTGYQLICN